MKCVTRLECTTELPIRPEWLQNSNQSTDNYNLQSILHDQLKETPENIFSILRENVEINRTCNKLIELLRASVRQRISATPKFCRNCIRLSSPCSHPKIGILFSGGVDCTIIARLVDQLINPDESIDLINVSFEKVSRQKMSIINYDTPDRVSARNSLHELQLLNDKR